jgi:hypothetical protein
MSPIEEDTNQLRTSEAPDWRRLREHVIGVGLDPSDVAVADLFSDDVDQRFGILVSADGRAYQFMLELGRRGDPRQRLQDVQVSEWEEIVSDDVRTRYARVIEPGLQFLKRKKD